MRSLRASGISRTAAGVAVAGLTAGLALTGPAVQAATPQARSASDWLVGQIDGGLVSSEYQGQDGGWVSYVDHGLALDFYFAFDQLRVRTGQRAQVLAAIEPQAAEYTDAYGTTYAGAIGKLLTAVQAQGIDPAAYGEGDLLTRLEGLVVDSGPEQGRAKDVSDWGDTSNTFGQAYVATGLTQARSALAADSIGFLLKQQCAAGFFRQDMSSADFTCDGGTAEESGPSVDATATAALALRQVVGQAPASVRDQARTAMRAATRWLASQQVRSGTFAGGRNTNSTGLAARALLEAGRVRPAAKAARWVNRFRVTPRLARRTDLRRGDVGAIAYNGVALKLGKREGITRDSRYQWRRSTAQAAPALDALRR